MKVWRKLFLTIFIMAWAGTVSAGTLADYIEARRVVTATAACMAAYNNRPGSLAVAAFEQEGWRVEPFKKTGEKADARYLLAWDSGSVSDKDVYLLAVAGTENVRDVKVDLRSRKVYFAGASLAEFEANAALKDVPGDVPRVHEGFNQAAQVLLSAGSAQSQDDQPAAMRLLRDILKEDHEDKVYLTGHSLGGAVVTLVAARLLDMGVNPEQIEVITFGAPAVGNEEFVKKYDGKINLTRFLVEGDPVPYALRKVFGGYRHIGREVLWRAPDPLKNYFSHDVPVYIDLALKNYYVKRRRAIREGIIAPTEPIPGKPRLYVSNIKNSLPDALKSEFPFMQEALWEEYDQISPGIVPGSADTSLLSEREKAAAAGCSLLVVPEILGQRVRDDNTWYVSLNQTVYRVKDGTVLNVGIYGGNTKELTPMGALIHGARTMRAESAAWTKTE